MINNAEKLLSLILILTCVLFNSQTYKKTYVCDKIACFNTTQSFTLQDAAARLMCSQITNLSFDHPANNSSSDKQKSKFDPNVSFLTKASCIIVLGSLPCLAI